MMMNKTLVLRSPNKTKKMVKRAAVFLFNLLKKKTFYFWTVTVLFGSPTNEDKTTHVLALLEQNDKIQKIAQVWMVRTIDSVVLGGKDKLITYAVKVILLHLAGARKKPCYRCLMMNISIRMIALPIMTRGIGDDQSSDHKKVHVKV